MKFKTGICILLCMLALLTGCGRETDLEEPAGYQVYYVDSNGTRLQAVSYTPVADTFEELMDELIERLSDNEGLYPSPLKNGVKLQGYQRGIDALRIDFSQEYYDLDNISEILLRAAVIKTFSQVPGVQKIMITVDGEQLLDENGTAIPPMDGESFIDAGEGGINSYQFATISLYFPNEDGKLKLEKRSLKYSSNMVLENVVLEQLVKGPQEDGVLPVFTAEMKVNSISVGEGKCLVDLNAAAAQVSADTSSDPVVNLYAIVNSLCETCDDIQSVSFTINGDSSALFGGEVSIKDPFWMNLPLIESSNSAAGYQTPPIGVDPSLAPQADGSEM